MSNHLYSDVDPAEIIEQVRQEREKAAAVARRPGTSIYWEPPQGRSAVRILPPRLGSGSPFVKFWRHAITLHPSLGGRTVMFSCVSKMGGRGQCPGCAYVSKLIKEGASRDSEIVKKSDAKARGICNVVVRGQEDEGVKTWNFPAFSTNKGGKKSTYDTLVDLCETAGAYYNPLNGTDLIIQRSGVGLDTVISITPDIRGYGKPLHNDDIIRDELLGGMHDLAHLTRILTMEEMEAKLRGEKIGGTGNAQSMIG